MGVSINHQYVFENGLFQLNGGTSCLSTTLIWQITERMHVVYSSWFSWRYESLLLFGIGGPRFFPRVAATMISKCFVKLGIKVYFWIYPSCERALKNGRVKPKIVRKSSFGDMIFLTSHDYIWLLFICFLYCTKEGVVVKISKVS